MSFIGDKNSRHCTTCGANYTPLLASDEDGVREVGGHECPYPYSTFFVEEKTEFKYEEGLLYSRAVKFTRYSGHDVENRRLNSATDWKKCE